MSSSALGGLYEKAGRIGRVSPSPTGRLVTGQNPGLLPEPEPRRCWRSWHEHSMGGADRCCTALDRLHKRKRGRRIRFGLDRASFSGRSRAPSSAKGSARTRSRPFKIVDRFEEVDGRPCRVSGAIMRRGSGSPGFFRGQRQRDPPSPGAARVPEGASGGDRGASLSTAGSRFQPDRPGTRRGPRPPIDDGPTARCGGTALINFPVFSGPHAGNLLRATAGVQGGPPRPGQARPRPREGLRGAPPRVGRGAQEDRRRAALVGFRKHEPSHGPEHVSSSRNAAGANRPGCAGSWSRCSRSRRPAMPPGG